ncbi:L-threonylcarbamoyladenylate synthase [uncultured Actinomyces sp.]|uniref:L-threonylcarbamoyladenylate synthase n=1 Tax=uncultured Actinomyces sp. TaxID=249061 RepID=UPI0037DC1477
MTAPETDPVPTADVARAARYVRAGGLLILPTDTVYGIGTTARDGDAVARLLAAKGRGRQAPPPVLVPGPQALDGLVAALPAAGRALVDAFWPGALTLVLDAVPHLGWDLGETGGTLALRMPDHPLALALLAATGPMAVTSANRTGRPPATSAADAVAAFPGRVRPIPDLPEAAAAHAPIALLDGGPTPGPVPSTILTLAGAHATAPAVLRDGALTRYALNAVLAGCEGVTPLPTRAEGAAPTLPRGATTRPLPPRAGAAEARTAAAEPAAAEPGGARAGVTAAEAGAGGDAGGTLRGSARPRRAGETA